MTLRSRISPQQLDDLRNRRITGRALAKELEVGEHWLSRNYSAKKINKIKGPITAAKEEKKVLAEARKEYRDDLARQVIRGKLSIAEAAKRACCVERTMYRYVKRVENADSRLQPK